MSTLIPKFSLKNGGATPIGAANRFINEKLAEIVSIKDFGAIGDGTTDDTIAIQAAMDYCESSNTNVQLLIPIGTYKVTSTLYVRSRYPVIGEGWASVIDYQGSGSGIIVHPTVGSPWEDDYRRGFLLQNFKLTTTAGTPTYGLQFGSTASPAPFNGPICGSVINLYIEGFNQTNAAGLYLQQTVDAYFERVYCAFNYNGALVWPTTFGTTTTFNKCSFRSNVNHGFYMNSGVSFNFYDCLFESNGGNGLKVTSQGTLDGSIQWLTINKCYFESNCLTITPAVQQYDLLIAGSSSIDIIQNITINDGHFVSTYSSISLDNIRYVDVINCTGSNSPPVGEYALKLINTSGASYGLNTRNTTIAASPNIIAFGIDQNVSLALGVAGTHTHVLKAASVNQNIASDGVTVTTIYSLNSTYTTQNYGGLVLVSGINAAGTSRFTDLVLIIYGATTPVTASAISVGAITRTYAMSANYNLTLVLTGGLGAFNLRASALANE